MTGRTVMGNQADMQEMIELFEAELRLCRLDSSQKRAVLSEGENLKDYAEAFLRAGDNLGAETAYVHLTSANTAGADAYLGDLSGNPLTNNPAALAILKEADLVIDLVFLLFSAEQIEIQRAGTRMLLVVEPFEILKRLFPTETMRRRVEAGERRMQAARTLRFANRAGTDVVYELEQLDGPPPRCILTEYGYTDTPGRWDHWPSGFLASTGTAAGVEGRVVMDAGDLILPQKEVVQTPIAFTIRDGYITGIDGGADARRLAEYMEGFDDPRAFAVSHVGWGLNEDAKWDVTLPGICMDGRAYYGNVLFSTGPNTEFGGDNDTACHLDLPMKNCSLWLDNDIIVRDGEVIPEDLRARGH